MDFKKLFETQQALDNNIMEKHPELKGQNNLDWKVLALQVELGECANEWRGFKTWSNDQEPRRATLLEEYVDCLHFALSIGLELGVQVESVYLLDKYKQSITQQFSGLMVAIGLLAVHDGPNRTETYKDIFAGIIRLGLKLGFTLEQIEAAYYDKNQINIERQASGY